MPREDGDISEAIEDIVKKEGITVRTSATCISFQKRGNKILAGVDCVAESRACGRNAVLLAVGRRPNTDDLGLDKAGVQCDKKGYITVDESCEPTCRESGR